MYKISEQLANIILQYLASRPYAEVWQMIQALQSVEKVEDTETQQKVKKS